MLKLDGLKFNGSFCHFFLFGLSYSFAFGSHFHDVADALPNEVVAIWIIYRIKIIGLDGQEGALVDNFFFLFIDVLEIFWLVFDLEGFVVDVVEHAGLGEMLEEGVWGPCQGIEESKELLLGTPEVHVVLELLFLLLHIR